MGRALITQSHTNMKAEAMHVSETFGTSFTELRIPFYQRSYVWSEENWRQLFNDVVNLCTYDNERHYFIGSIILSPINQTEQKWEVIDGQQRLTTLMLFLKALHLLTNRDGVFRNNYFQNEDHYGIEGLPKLKLNHQNTPEFNNILCGKDVPSISGGESKIDQCFDYFIERLKKLQANQDEEFRDVDFELRTVLQRCATSVYLVNIRLDSNENPQEIFSIINSTGVKLNTGELLKNYLFKEIDLETYRSGWKVILESETNLKWWEEIEKKTRTNPVCRLDKFLYRFLLVQLFKDNNRGKFATRELKWLRKESTPLFKKFQDACIGTLGMTKEYLSNEIVKHANIYYKLFNLNEWSRAKLVDNPLHRLVYFIIKTENLSVIPYIMYIIDSVQDQQEQNKIFSYLEKYLIRRSICKSVTKSYSDLFSENLIGSGIKTASMLYEYINQREGDLKMPDNNQVKEAILTNNQTKLARILLYLLEAKVNDEFEDIDDFDSLALEPLFPNKPASSWTLSDESRAFLKDTLGNHILLSNKITDKNKVLPWNNKRNIILQGDYRLFVTNEFISQQKTWTEEDIANRNEVLADIIIKQWSDQLEDVQENQVVEPLVETVDEPAINETKSTPVLETSFTIKRSALRRYDAARDITDNLTRGFTNIYVNSRAEWSTTERDVLNEFCHKHQRNQKLQVGTITKIYEENDSADFFCGLANIGANLYFPFIIKKKLGQSIDSYDDYGYCYRLFIADVDSVDRIENVSENALKNAFEDWIDDIANQDIWDY